MFAKDLKISPNLVTLRTFAKGPLSWISHGAL